MSSFACCLLQAIRACLENGRCELLGQFYDEVARETWSEAAKRNDEGFVLDVVSVQLDPDLLAEAKAFCAILIRVHALFVPFCDKARYDKRYVSARRNQARPETFRADRSKLAAPVTPTSESSGGAQRAGSACH